MISAIAVAAVWLLGIRSHKQLYEHLAADAPEYYGEISQPVLWTIASFWPIIELLQTIKELIYGD